MRPASLLRALDALAARPLAHRRLRLWRGLRGSPALLSRSPSTGRCSATMQPRSAPQIAKDLLRRTRPAGHCASCNQQRTSGETRALARQENRRRRRQPYRAEPARERGARCLFPKAGRSAARSRRCSSPMATPRACSASANNGPRPDPAALGAMAAPCVRPSLAPAMARQMTCRRRGIAHALQIRVSPRPIFWCGETPFCPRSIRVPAPRSTFSTAAPNAASAACISMRSARGKLPPRGLKFGMPWLSAIVYAPVRRCVPPAGLARLVRRPT